MVSRITFALIFAAFVPVLTQAQIYDGKTLKTIHLEDVVDQIRPGQVLLLGENHGLQAHQDQHLLILNALHKRGLRVSVGMEFVNYTDQLQLDLYRSGAISESEFLKNIGWGGYDFRFYKPQIDFPNKLVGGTTLGLNISRSVTRKISREGLQSLSPEERGLLPPNFELGRDSYRKRFMEASGSHCKVPENCFIAQCAWDDTMAWKAVEYIEAHPEMVLVVIVGEFHVQYGGGIKHRIHSRNPEVEVKTLSQVWTEGMTPEDIDQALQVSPVEGERADFIWISGP